MQRLRSRRVHGVSAAIVALSLLALVDTAYAADGTPDIPTRRLSDAPAWEAWAITRTTGFHMADGGPVTGPPNVPAKLPPPPPETAAVPPTAPAATPAAVPTAPSSAASGQCATHGGCDACDAVTTCSTGAATWDVNSFDCRTGWFDNASVFFVGDGWKNVFDGDNSSNFGFRTGFNMGVELPGDRAVHGQIGASYGAYDFHGRDALRSHDDAVEQQVFATGGVYKRSDIDAHDPLAWGAVYDLMVAEDAGERTDSLRLGQIRSYVGYALTACDEVGVWSAFRILRDDVPQGPVRVNATDQASLFWHRHWSRGGDTWTYAGWADDPGSVVVGLRGEAPLSSRVALTGNFHYILPSTHGGDIHPTLPVDNCFSQEAWNVSFGIVIYRCGKAVSPHVSGFQGLPLLSVADNGSFSYQAGPAH